MNKIELAEKISEKVGLPKAQIEHILDTFVDITINTLK
ncbi:MAG: HU family DNA-binding protein, partial [Patescibacteria group bacterium]